MCARIFLKLAPEFPSSERRVMDMVLRCAIEPRFHIDTDMLRLHLVDLAVEKETALARAGVTDAGELRSNDKFSALLTARGVDIVTKASLSDPEKQIPAFAKTDEFMSDLLEHEDPIVQALAAARLGVRSTIEQSRGARLVAIAELDWSKVK